MKEKFCVSCRNKKKKKDFRKNPNNKDGLEATCRKCREKYFSNFSSLIKKTKKWRLCLGPLCAYLGKKFLSCGDRICPNCKSFNERKEEAYREQVIVKARC